MNPNGFFCVLSVKNTQTGEIAGLKMDASRQSSDISLLGPLVDNTASVASVKVRVHDSGTKKIIIYQQ